MVIGEKLLPAATALASCGIAYAMRYVRAASEGGVQLGFRASEAQTIVAETLRGAAALLSQPGAKPASTAWWPPSGAAGGPRRSGNR